MFLFPPIDVGTFKDVIESNEDEMKVLQDQLEQKTNQTVALEEEHTALKRRFQEKCKELETLNNIDNEASGGNDTKNLQENVDQLCQEMQILKQKYEEETGQLQEKLDQKEQELTNVLANQQQEPVEDNNKLNQMCDELKVAQQKHLEELEAVREELKIKCQKLEEHKQQEKNKVCKKYILFYYFIQIYETERIYNNIGSTVTVFSRWCRILWFKVSNFLHTSLWLSHITI